MAANRVHYILIAVAVVLLLFGLAHQHGQVRDTINHAWTPHAADTSTSSFVGSSSKRPSVMSPISTSANDNDGLPTFYEIGQKFGTDKVIGHHFWFMYDKYFPAIRQKKLKMLEIGLGCDMNYGPGKSYYAWLEYFPHVDLYYMEYDAACAEKWAAETTGATIYAGDQADPVFLQKFITETGGNFDIIVDDGGHTMDQQRLSLEALWKTVKPGGLYFIEDLHTSFHTRYGGDVSHDDPNIKTMVKYIFELIDDKLSPDGTKHAMSMEMRGIDCQREICVFEKKQAGTI